MYVCTSKSSLPIVVKNIYDVYTCIFLLILNFEPIKINITEFITFSRLRLEYHAKRVPLPLLILSGYYLRTLLTITLNPTISFNLK